MQTRPPGMLLFPEHLRKTSLQMPHRAALGDASCTLSYRELWEAIEACAAGLRARGVGQGDRVATAVTPSVSHAVLILGCMAAGAIPAPLNIRLTGTEFERYLEPIRPVLLVCDAPHLDQVQELDIPLAHIEAPQQPAPLRQQMGELWSDHPWTADLAESDPALIIPTGGTTGVPKGAVFTHRSLYLWLASNMLNGARTRDDRELYFSPFFHVSIVTGWMASLFAGARVDILPRYSVDDAVRGLEKGATVLMGAPTMFTGLRAHPRFQEIPRDKVRSIGIGSMAATREFLARLMADYPSARVKHGYGATEFGPVTGILHDDFVAGRLEGVGYALAGCRIRVVDDQLNEVPAGEIGELVVSCPWQVAGYWGREEETRETFTDLGVRLGDLGRVDADGWFHIAGRKKEMIISGGENIFPNEVEGVLGRHPAVASLCVYGVSDPWWGERVEVAVVPVAGADASLEDIRAFGRAELGGYKLPKSMRIVEAIPLTPNNKPDRRRLRLESEAANVVATA